MELNFYSKNHKHLTIDFQDAYVSTMTDCNSNVSSTSDQQDQKYYIYLEDLEIGTCLRGVVTNVVDPITFYIQFENQKKYLFLNLMDDMQVEYDKAISYPVVELKKGDICMSLRLEVSITIVL